MSYLNRVRLHFAGAFRAHVSTVNNDPAHYDNATFEPSDRLLRTPGHANGWWQPAGTGGWSLSDCVATRACYADGSHSDDPSDDPAVGLAVTGAGDRAGAKLVDLDPQQQLVSTIWGLQVRLLDAASGVVSLRGEFEPAPFFDIWWNRARSGGGGDIGASAYYQSILEPADGSSGVIVDPAGSRVLQELRAASDDGSLSIKFMVDGYAMSGPKKSYGRIVGTIGPAKRGEPKHFVLGRHLAPVRNSELYYLECRLDRESRKIIADFGNALPTQTAGGKPADVGQVHLGVSDGGGWTDFGALNYAVDDWYATTAGIQEFPPDRPLSEAELELATKNPIVVMTGAEDAGGRLTSPSAQAFEFDGLYLRPDKIVHRLSPGDKLGLELYVTKFGEPQDGVEIDIQVSDFGLQRADGPELAVPADALRPQATAKSDGAGIASVEVETGAPGKPRGAIDLDGQLYAITYHAKGNEQTGSGFDQSNFVSVLLWDAYRAPSEVTWEQAVRPIFTQYANLYPRMHGPHSYKPVPELPPYHCIVDLSQYENVAGFADFISFAMSLPERHPNHMPVVRDLSPAKREMILGWLETRGTDGKPLRGAAVAVATAAPPAGRPPSRREAAESELGGKTAAGRQAKVPRPIAGPDLSSPHLDAMIKSLGGGTETDD